MPEKKGKKIRPCPFCGFDECEIRVVDRQKEGWRLRHFVLCNYDRGGCGAAGGERHSVTEAVDCWNERRRKYRG